MYRPGDVSYYTCRTVMYALGLALFVGLLGASIVGLVLSSITYATYVSPIESSNCNVTSCVASEGSCGSTTCFTKTLQFSLDYRDVVYDTSYTESSHNDLGPCEKLRLVSGKQSFPEMSQSLRLVADGTVTCYYDTTNINGTLTLQELNDFTLGDAQANIIVSVCGIVLCALVAGILLCATIAMYRQYREAKADRQYARTHPTG